MLEASVPFYPLSVGELVGGKYRINSKLGEGGMGVVFGATHVDLNCAVALKIIRQELNQQPELIARLMQEARAAAQIRSEHVCRVLDVSRLDNGSPYVVMEHLEGRNLGTIIEAKGRLSEHVAVDYVLQACEAIAEAHRAGIVHRDLKPENLFLAEFPDGRRAIKVLDFGISKAIRAFDSLTERSLTNPSSAMGSPHFMAPEQMTEASTVDERADVWALGAILYQMLSGELPFDGDSLPAVCAAVLQSSPPPLRAFLPAVSSGLEDAISLCLVKNREHRLGSVAELAHLIAPFGSPQASLSAVRISRLLEDAEPARSSGEYNQGTLLSSAQLPTPKTPVRVSNGGFESNPSAPRLAPIDSPIETTIAVTSSRRDIDVSGLRRRRGVWFIAALAALALLGVLALVMRTQNAPVPSADERPSVAALTPSAVPSPPRGDPAPVVSSNVEAAKPVQDSAALAAVPSAKASAAPIAPSPPATSRYSSPKPHPVTAPKKSTDHPLDPYNLDNFGGRR